jgi:hypothetical protein
MLRCQALNKRPPKPAIRPCDEDTHTWSFFVLVKAFGQIIPKTKMGLL